MLAVAAIDHSGRTGDQSLLSALGWRPGERTAATVTAEMAILRRTHTGPFRIDSRHKVFIPAGTRALFSIDTGDRVVLVAAPEHDVLIVHPMAVIANLIAVHYASKPGGLDVL